MLVPRSGSAYYSLNIKIKSTKIFEIKSFTKSQSWILFVQIRACYKNESREHFGWRILLQICPSTVIPRKLAVPNSRNSQTRGFCYLVAWKPPNWLFTIKMAPYLAVSKFAVPYYPTPKICEFGGITVHARFDVEFDPSGPLTGLQGSLIHYEVIDENFDKVYT